MDFFVIEVVSVLRLGQIGVQNALAGLQKVFSEKLRKVVLSQRRAVRLFDRGNIVNEIARHGRMRVPRLLYLIAGLLFFFVGRLPHHRLRFPVALLLLGVREVAVAAALQRRLLLLMFLHRIRLLLSLRLFV